MTVSPEDVRSIVIALWAYVALEVLRFLVTKFPWPKISVRRVGVPAEYRDAVEAGPRIIRKWRRKMVSDIKAGMKVDPQDYVDKAKAELDEFVEKFLED